MLQLSSPVFSLCGGNAWHMTHQVPEAWVTSKLSLINHQSSSSPNSMPKSFYSYLMEKLFFHEKLCIRLSLNWRNELDKEITLVYPYFSVWFKSSNATILVFYEERNLGIRDSHLTKLMANDWKQWISLLISHCSHFHFSFFFVFAFVFFIPSWYQFISVWFNFWLHIFLIIIIIIQCSGMFRDVPECSMFLVLWTPVTPNLTS